MFRMQASRRLAFFSAVTLLTASGLACAQEDYQIIRAFTNADGGPPHTGLIKATDGNFYGGGPRGMFRLTPDGAYTVISSLPAGFDPIQASDGYLYATGSDSIFRMSVNGEVTILHSITDTFFDGQLASPLVEGDDGNFYGLTELNGEFRRGTIFRITPAGVFTTLRSVTPAEGYLISLIKGSDGYFYGCAGGETGYGTLFRMTTDGTATVLHVFTGGVGGSVPARSGLIETADGSLYGATVAGGAYDAGVVFRLRRDGEFTILHSFTGLAPGGDGITGWTKWLLEGSDGALYGSAAYGIFRLTPEGEVRLLHSIASYPDGAGTRRYGRDLTRLVEGADGNFYGTARDGGPGGSGVIFRLNRHRSPCANDLDLVWQRSNDGTVSGILYLIGAVKSETPALMGAWLVSALGIGTLSLQLTPAITPAFAFELALPFKSLGTVGVFSVVVTSNLDACSDWATVDTGGTGPSAAELKRLLQQSSVVREGLAGVRRP